MSPWLMLGVVLLVIVGVLSVWQRRNQVDHTSRRDGPVPPVPRGASPGTATVEGGPQQVRGALQLTDPELGLFEFNGDRLWTADSMDFDGVPLLAELQGDRHGLHPTARQLAVSAQQQARALWLRGKELVIAELARRGVPIDDVEPYEVAVDVEDGEAVAYLWYDAGTFDGDIGVSSRDGWRTLALEVIE